MNYPMAPTVYILRTLLDVIEVARREGSTPEGIKHIDEAARLVYKMAECLGLSRTWRTNASLTDTISKGIKRDSNE